ncbi:phosphoribosylamine--glycine ligase [Salinarimonas chemoclinalis]|uniref:phosphoribosylamine--glycine ligase n=1 Tax=Salinarimonas chemoclinalis TaxID=3241599 RepID=UPI003557035A
MNVLLIGSGGREHALAWKLVQSPLCDTLFCAPGNAGTAEVATNVGLDVADHAAVIAFCRAAAIGLVVVGNEAPLVAGLVDDLAAAEITAFGPTREAARLEGSKAFTKAICDETGAPTAAWARFDAAEAALARVRERGAPIVVKYDGLAAGKGVVVAETTAQAEEAVRAMLAGPGDALVIEDFLEGEEVSLFALCDGTTALPLASAQDHKRAFDGDVGPNTGGMGAYSPAPVLTPELQARAMAEIVEPTLAALRARGTPFVGVLYAGLMIGTDGPKLVEYNVRFGDPEAQALMPRLEGDLLAAMLAACEGRLSEVSLGWRDEAALVVTLAARGYPGAVETGSEIRGLDAAAALPGVRVFHAGTRRDGDRVLASGGRVLSVVGLGADVAEARARAYAGVDAIDWPQGFCRRDIGWRALAR